MEKYLKPNRFDCEPNVPGADKQWRHWLRTFQNFIRAAGETGPNKLDTLINCVGANVFELISECDTYDSAIDVLKRAYEKPPNEIFARHTLATRRQGPGKHSARTYKFFET